jgi:hypothetical protein
MGVVLSGRGLCYGLITRPEECYRLWRFVLCDLETSWMRRRRPALGRSAKKEVSKVWRFRPLRRGKCARTSKMAAILRRRPRTAPYPLRTAVSIQTVCDPRNANFSNYRLIYQRQAHQMPVREHTRTVMAVDRGLKTGDLLAAPFLALIAVHLLSGMITIVHCKAVGDT